MSPWIKTETYTPQTMHPQKPIMEMKMGCPNSWMPIFNSMLKFRAKGVLP